MGEGERERKVLEHHTCTMYRIKMDYENTGHLKFLSGCMQIIDRFVIILMQ